MSKTNASDSTSLLSELSEREFGEMLKELKKANKRAKKRNALIEKQYQQEVLDYELAQRRYLIEKSALQPTFRLTVTEFLTCEPDFVNDPEQASEAKFLSEYGVASDQRALRVRVEAKGGDAYMRPSLIISQVDKNKNDERLYSMNERTYFIDVDSLDLSESANSTIAYFVYHDRTTLPVLHKYHLTQRLDSALRRWDALHMDTVYASAKQTSGSLITCKECATLFKD